MVGIVEASSLLQLAAHELALFAAVGFLLFGLDDLLVDLIWIGRTAWRRLAVYSRFARADATTLAAPERPGRFALMVPAWDEADVIGAMLASTLERVRHADYRIFVGCYPNDPATIAIVRAFADRDARVRLVTTPRAGPTTKADCLNAIARAVADDEVASGIRYKAVVLHDAEDVVHSDELRVCSGPKNWAINSAAHLRRFVIRDRPSCLTASVRRASPRTVEASDQHRCFGMRAVDEAHEIAQLLGVRSAATSPTSSRKPASASRASPK